MKCPVCKGKGKQFLDLDVGKFNPIIKCLFCYGKKELDWIECIFGVDHKYIWFPPAGFDKIKKRNI